MYQPRHLGPDTKKTGGHGRLWWTLAFVAWLCVVWGHSLMPGDLSSLESSRFVFLLRPLFELFGSTDEQLMTFVIRKGAHFTEYVILLALGRRMAHAWRGRRASAWVLTFVLWVACPCIDEFIQLHVPGRAGMPTDVLIDMAGGLLGLLLASLACRKK